MTREEASFYLTNMDRKYMEEGMLEALEVAIKALEQEPFKPMVEIDLDYVIKQKYIERDVLDKIYADIQRLRGCSCSCSDGIIDDVEDILDKYKAEIEPQESEDKE